MGNPALTMGWAAGLAGRRALPIFEMGSVVYAGQDAVHGLGSLPCPPVYPCATDGATGFTAVGIWIARRDHGWKRGRTAQISPVIHGCMYEPSTS